MGQHPAALRGGSGHSDMGRRNGPMSKSQERIYSAQQMVQALKSALAAVRDQLQVLTILDSNAMSWPGIQQAVDDMEFLVDMSSQTTNKMEAEHKNMEAQLKDTQAECQTLRETLAMQNQSKEELEREVDQLNKEVKKLTSQLDGANREVQQQKQVRDAGQQGTRHACMLRASAWRPCPCPCHAHRPSACICTHTVG